MNPRLDHIIDRLVARAARSCLAPEVDDRAGLHRDMMDALRLIGGLRDGGRLVVREKLHWLFGEITRRLLCKVESRVSPR
jgi:hypothetical protein